MPCYEAILLEQDDELRRLLIESAELVAEWGGYAPIYFQNKHDLQGDIDGIKNAAKTC